MLNCVQQLIRSAQQRDSRLRWREFGATGVTGFKVRAAVLADYHLAQIGHTNLQLPAAGGALLIEVNRPTHNGISFYRARFRGWRWAPSYEINR